MTTVTISAYAAILLALPVSSTRLYAFVLPAFSPTRAPVALPLLLMVPVLFVAGVAFGYFVVLPAGGALPPQLQREPVQHPGAGADYYSFVSLTLLAMGLCSRSRGDPRGHAARDRDAAQLRQWRRYAYLGSRSWPRCCRASTPSRC